MISEYKRKKIEARKEMIKGFVVVPLLIIAFLAVNIIGEHLIDLWVG